MRPTGAGTEFALPRALFFSIALGLLAGCSSGLDQKFDAPTEASYRASLERLRKHASPEEVKQVEDALRVLAVPDVSIGFEGGILGALEKLRGQRVDTLGEAVSAQVDGRTGRDIVAVAKVRLKQEAEKQLQAEKAEMAKLERAKGEKEAAREFLAKVEIQEPRIAILGTDAQRMGVLDFKVANGSEETLASLFLRASVAGADGKILFTDEFTYRASPPIAAGQVRDVRLPSNSPNKWNSPELAKQSQLGLQLQVENASTLAGSKLAASFTQKDAERLAMLAKHKPKLEALVANP
jgi:hypothetical protein